MNGYIIEKVINNYADALSKLMGKKVSYTKGTRRQQDPSLYDNLMVLQNEGLTLDELGRLYVNFLFENKPGKMLAKLKSTKGGPGFEKFKGIIKREIQKDTRHYFSEKVNNLIHDGLKPEQIIPDNDLGKVQYEFDLHFKKDYIKEDTIEAIVNKLLDDRLGCFGNIGHALFEGAERYEHKKEGKIHLPFYKLFLEYDSILRALRKEI